MRQTEGCDYIETFSPIIKAISIQTVLTVAFNKGWEVMQLDISNVFLHGMLEERITVSQPFGFEDPNHLEFVCLYKHCFMV